jgi:subtilisin family serine protease
VKAKIRRKIIAWLFAATTLFASLALALAQQSVPQNPPYPQIEVGRGGAARGDDGIDKLSPELRILYAQYGPTTRGGEQSRYSDEQLRELFNLKTNEANPYVGVVLTVAAQTNLAELKQGGLKIYYRQGQTIFGEVPVRSLGAVAGLSSVLAIAATKASHIPTPPQSTEPPKLELPTRGEPSGAPVRLSNEFNSGGLTGKGVIIGIVDSGIDWQHPDFIRPDGTSRILALWDQEDDSYKESQGRTGSRPPVLTADGDALPGTVYTNAQINAALKGRGKVNSQDNHGHGTAVAGTAAGNGRATTSKVPAGSWKGVAPEADLIIVKAGDCGGISRYALFGTYWIANTAQELKRPVVINHSYGRHFSSHRGDDEDEVVMDGLLALDTPGLAMTVAAGNEGQFSFHASGRFAPRRKGQADVDGSPLEINISPKRTQDMAFLTGWFDSQDEWGLALKGSGNYFVDENGKPLDLYVFKVNGQLQVQLQRGVKAPFYFEQVKKDILTYSKLAAAPGQPDRLVLPLPPGSYYLWGFGVTENVKNGNFELYLPDARLGGFTIGVVKKGMVGSPGNAANVITVAAYDFRASWTNQKGERTVYNLTAGEIAPYSSPGGPRGKDLYKPDLAAPATYSISSFSQTASFGKSSCGENNLGAAGWQSVTPDGYHIAWAGTSAAAPYTAGVIALMLQKNPSLTSAQIKSILLRTATKDNFVGATPNPEWGYGKINPEAALAATPPVKAQPRRTVRR